MTSSLDMEWAYSQNVNKEKNYVGKLSKQANDLSSAKTNLNLGALQPQSPHRAGSI